MQSVSDGILALLTINSGLTRQNTCDLTSCQQQAALMCTGTTQDLYMRCFSAMELLNDIYRIVLPAGCIWGYHVWARAWLLELTYTLTTHHYSIGEHSITNKVHTVKQLSKHAHVLSPAGCIKFYHVGQVGQSLIAEADMHQLLLCTSTGKNPNNVPGVHCEPAKEPCLHCLACWLHQVLPCMANRPKPGH